MSASSKTRSRLLATASILCAAILLVLPSAFNFISGAEHSTVPSGSIIADGASREDLALSHRTRPEAESQPLARDPRGHGPSLSVLESGSDQTLDAQIADAILREVYEQEMGEEDLVAYLLRDPFYGDFVGLGTGGLTGTIAGNLGIGNGGITASGSAFRGGGMGGGGFLGAPGQGGTNAPVNGNPGLSAFNEIPGLVGQPPGAGVVFTPKVDGGELVMSPEIELPWTDTRIPFGPQTSQFDQAAVPKSPTSVPEPATLALTGLGLCGLIAKARAGRKRSQ